MEQNIITDFLDFFSQLPPLLNACERILHNRTNDAEIWHARLEIVLNFINIVMESFREINVSFHIFDYVSQLRNLVRQALCNVDNYLNLPIRCQKFGRPRLAVTKEEIEENFQLFRNWKTVALFLGISSKTLYRRRIEFGMKISATSGPRQSYSDISQNELCQIVREILNINPDSGESLVIGALRRRQVFVQRWRVREAIFTVDPISRMLRRCLSVVRRRYNVASPNALWHIDGHHKLIRWKLVIHGGIDGFSRLIVYLECSPNNLSRTVLTLFQNAVENHGLPERVRCDMGVENRGVSRFMLHNRGINRRSMLVGSSVHNQRIERLWRDVKRVVVRSFQTIFYFLEDLGILDPLNEIHLLVLHIVFLPAINASLAEFTDDWNHHPLSTERNLSPYQIRHIGFQQYRQVNPDGFQHLTDYEWDRFGIDEDILNIPNDDDDDNDVYVPDVSAALSRENIDTLKEILRNLDNRHDDIEKYEIILDSALTMI